MRMRAERLGGTLEIKRENGTIVLLKTKNL
jgi:signal transduction histidine kinase